MPQPPHTSLLSSLPTAWQIHTPGSHLSPIAMAPHPIPFPSHSRAGQAAARSAHPQVVSRRRSPRSDPFTTPAPTLALPAASPPCHDGGRSASSDVDLRQRRALVATGHQCSSRTSAALAGIPLLISGFVWLGAAAGVQPCLPPLTARYFWEPVGKALGQVERGDLPRPLNVRDPRYASPECEGPDDADDRHLPRHRQRRRRLQRHHLHRTCWISSRARTRMVRPSSTSSSSTWTLTSRSSSAATARTTRRSPPTPSRSSSTSSARVWCMCRQESLSIMDSPSLRTLRWRRL